MEHTRRFYICMFNSSKFHAFSSRSGIPSQKKDPQASTDIVSIGGKSSMVMKTTIRPIIAKSRDQTRDSIFGHFLELMWAIPSENRQGKQNGFAYIILSLRLLVSNKGNTARFPKPECNNPFCQPQMPISLSTLDILMHIILQAAGSAIPQVYFHKKNAFFKRNHLSQPPKRGTIEIENLQICLIR